MAEEAGVWPKPYDHVPPSAVFRERVEKFAQLVAAAEREECAKLADEAARMLAPIHPHHQAVAMAIGMKIRART